LICKQSAAILKRRWISLSTGEQFPCALLSMAFMKLELMQYLILILRSRCAQMEIFPCKDLKESPQREFSIYNEGKVVLLQFSGIDDDDKIVTLGRWFRYNSIALAAVLKTRI
jgi:aspartokinase